MSALAVTSERERLGDRDWLQHAYVDEGKSARQIAAIVGCRHTRVLQALRHHGIPARTISAAQAARHRKRRERRQQAANGLAAIQAQIHRQDIRAALAAGDTQILQQLLHAARDVRDALDRRTGDDDISPTEVVALARLIEKLEQRLHERAEFDDVRARAARRRRIAELQASEETTISGKSVGLRRAA